MRCGSLLGYLWFSEWRGTARLRGCPPLRVARDGKRLGLSGESQPLKTESLCDGTGGVDMCCGAVGSVDPNLSRNTHAR